MSTFSKIEKRGLHQAKYLMRLAEKEISVTDKRISGTISKNLAKVIEANYLDYKVTPLTFKSGVIEPGTDVVTDPAAVVADLKSRANADVSCSVMDEGYGRYRVVASGDEILYDEFGTGEEGAKSNPPTEYGSQHASFSLYKSRYGLSDFNSGPHVSKHIDEDMNHYWFYNTERLYGVPTGGFVFSAYAWMEEFGKHYYASYELDNTVRNLYNASKRRYVNRNNYKRRGNRAIQPNATIFDLQGDD